MFHSLFRRCCTSPPFDRHQSSCPRRAFTLIELLVSLAILLIVLITLVQFMTDVDRAWKSAGEDPFADAAEAFENLIAHLTTATLESYQDYADTTGTFRTAISVNFVPDHLARRSDLAFACGPAGDWLAKSGRTTASGSVFFVAPEGYTQTQAHLGLQHLLDALGYFVEFSNESAAPAFLMPAAARWRWCLKEMVQPAEALQIYAIPTSLAWVQAGVQAGAPVSTLAENIVALVVLPERAASDTGAALAPAYQYDSRNAADPLTRHQLPARLRLALVAIDEVSAQMLAAQNGAAAPALVPSTLFTTATQMDADLASLDAQLTARRVHHRIFQREILLPSAAWSNTLSQ
jgi:uncharacterized protein (TIGR02599 family)